MKTVQLIVGISRGIIREQRTRRTVMFYSVLVALLWLFAGATFLDEWLRARPWLFLLYWAACAWITVLAVLLACFDILMVRARVRREQRRLAAEHLAEIKNHDPRSR
jgi:predicted tellurium resistance membrane protein TerC